MARSRRISDDWMTDPMRLRGKAAEHEARAATLTAKGADHLATLARLTANVLYRKAQRIEAARLEG